MSSEAPRKKLKRDAPEEVLDSAVNSILQQDDSDNDISEPENRSEHNQDSGDENENNDHSSPVNVEPATPESCDERSPVNAASATQESFIAEADDDKNSASSPASHSDITDLYKTLEEDGLEARVGKDIVHIENDSDESSPVNAVSATQESSTAGADDDNNAASSAVSHSDIIADHYNSLEEKGLQARDNSRIIYMRNFNNWIKSTLLSGFLKKVKASKKEGEEINVLDMGCGKGGDLFKWRDGGVTHAIFADLAETSVGQCEKRYEDLKRKQGRHRMFSAEFIAADCTRARLRDLYKNPSIQLDLVSCQFAFHYCWESLPQAECMLKNVSECLRVGGFFVGTCPNAYTIMSRLRKAGGKEFGNSVYSIQFEQEYPDGVTPPLFGAKYNFHLEGVVDCPEFLVHFPTLRELARKYGFEIYTKLSFASFYKTKLQERSEEYDKLLHRMNALEAYPNDKLVAPKEEYSHAEDFINEHTNGSATVGTLSKAEWEAISLYLVFVFKKLKEMDPDW